MKHLRSALLFSLLASTASAGHSAISPNLIDTTYGIGTGSFELGIFVPRGTGNLDFQSLSNGATTMTGWVVGGIGVDWLH